MKKIEAYIRADRSRAVVDGLKKTGVTGLSIHEIKGQGAGARPVISGLKGTARFVAEFSNSCVITTIVDDSRVDQVISAITDAASSGSKGDGKIFVSTVDEVVDISTKRKGVSAL